VAGGCARRHVPHGAAQEQRVSSAISFQRRVSWCRRAHVNGELGVEDEHELAVEFADAGDQGADVGWDGFGGLFEGFLAWFEDVADLVDQQAYDVAVIGADHDVDRWCPGGSGGEPESGSQFEGGDDLAS
jgi:hypothetical protein